MCLGRTHFRPEESRSTSHRHVAGGKRRPSRALPPVLPGRGVVRGGVGADRGHACAEEMTVETQACRLEQTPFGTVCYLEISFLLP